MPKVGNWVEWRVPLDENIADGTALTEPLSAYCRYEQSSTGVAGGLVRQPLGGTKPLLYRQVDGRRCMSPEMVASVDTHPINFFFASHGRPLALRLEFRDALGPIVGTVGDDAITTTWNTSISAWLRKRQSGDGSHAKFTLGFGDLNLIYPSGGNPRLGLIGNGTGGYRFGSVNCPDGINSYDNVATDIDANSFQPPELASPGLNWFHVRIKMIPPTSLYPASWEAYLNGTLQATFTSSTNFSRGSNGVNKDYANTSAGFFTFADTVNDIPAPYIHDLRYTWEEIVLP